jgi:predicted transcriptional regulator
MGTQNQKTASTVRRSISLSREIDSKVQSMARRQNRSANRVMEHLIETGLEAKEAEKRRFFELTERLRTASDPTELQQIKEELARMTFGV